MKTKHLLIFLSSVVLPFLTVQTPVAQPQELRKIHTAIIAPSVSFLPLYVAGQRGFFREQGISNEIVVIRSSANQIQALVAGSVQFSAQAPAPLIRAVEKGADLVLLSGMVNAPTYDLVAGKNYKSIEELRGTTLAVSGIADAITVLLQEMLSAHRLFYPRDYHLVQVGGSNDRLAAIQKGSVAATLLDPPRNYIAKDEGFNILGQLKDYIPELQFTTISASRAWVYKNEPLVKDYLVSLLKANRYIYENKAGAQSIMQEILKVKPEYVERVYDYWVRNKVLPMDGAVSVKGTEVILNILEKMGDFERKARPKAEKYIDMKPVTRARASLQ